MASYFLNPLFSLSPLIQVGLVRVVVSLESPGPAEMPGAPVLHVPPAPAVLPAAPVLRVRAGGPEPSAAVHSSGGPAGATSASLQPRTAQQYGGTVENVSGLPLKILHSIPPATAAAASSASAPPPEYQVAWELEVWKRGKCGREGFVDASVHADSLYSSSPSAPTPAAGMQCPPPSSHQCPSSSHPNLPPHTTPVQLRRLHGGVSCVSARPAAWRHLRGSGGGGTRRGRARWRACAPSMQGWRIGRARWVFRDDMLLAPHVGGM